MFRLIHKLCFLAISFFSIRRHIPELHSVSSTPVTGTMHVSQAATVSSVESVVIKRRKNLMYTKKAHMGKIHYLNTMRLSKPDISRMKDKEKKCVAS